MNFLIAGYYLLPLNGTKLLFYSENSSSNIIAVTIYCHCFTLQNQKLFLLPFSIIKGMKFVTIVSYHLLFNMFVWSQYYNIYNSIASYSQHQKNGINLQKVEFINNDCVNSIYL